MSPRDRPLVLCAVVSGRWLLAIPFDQAPDEFAHVHYNVRVLLAERRLPVMGVDDTSAYLTPRSNPTGRLVARYSYANTPVPYIGHALTAWVGTRLAGTDPVRIVAEARKESGHTVVLVEGDPTHRRLLQAVLRGQGHDVETVRTPAEADRVIAQQPDAVLVTDCLPGASPTEAAAWLAARPALKVLGTSDEVARALAHVTEPRQALAISRPLAALQITEAVKALFDGQAALDGPDGDGDPLAPLWFKLDRGQPIHPLEAS